MSFILSLIEERRIALTPKQADKKTNAEIKNKVFTIQSDVFYDKNNSEIVIIELKLDGLTTNENSASGFMEFHRNAYYTCDDNGVSCTLSDRPECKPPSSDSVMETREAEAAETRRILNSKCFYIVYFQFFHFVYSPLNLQFSSKNDHNH